MGKSNQAIIEALTQQKKDEWARAVNAETPGSFNLGSRAVWNDPNGFYTKLRAYGATHMNPGGLDAAYTEAIGGMLGELEKQTKA